MRNVRLKIMISPQKVLRMISIWLQIWLSTHPNAQNTAYNINNGAQPCSSCPGPRSYHLI